MRKAVSELTLDKLILKEALTGNVWFAPSVQGASTVAESSLRKCIRPLASGLLLQPGHDESCTHRSQLSTPGSLPAFADRAYDTPINALVIGPRISQTDASALCSGWFSPLI